MKVARSALRISLAHWERAGVRETVMAPATYIVRGGTDAMAVSGSPIAETGHADLVRSLSDGRQALSVAELEAIDRLAALIPPPAAPFCS